MDMPNLSVFVEVTLFGYISFVTYSQLFRILYCWQGALLIFFQKVAFPQGAYDGCNFFRCSNDTKPLHIDNTLVGLIKHQEQTAKLLLVSQVHPNDPKWSQVVPNNIKCLK